MGMTLHGYTDAMGTIPPLPGTTSDFIPSSIYCGTFENGKYGIWTISSGENAAGNVVEVTCSNSTNCVQKFDPKSGFPWTPVRKAPRTPPDTQTWFDGSSNIRGSSGFDDEKALFDCVTYLGDNIKSIKDLGDYARRNSVQHTNVQAS